ncbi:MAG: uroporphyrinogen-III C-methyltransferase [Desulfovibrio sp.]|nr:uroporphyrinogen-III C-methyltransferase [Desulfovibrio sp.]
MKVCLLGAGPGDPGLLTIRARDVLASADVVVYDALAFDGLLDLADPDAELVYVGKVAGSHAMSQDRINALLIAKAREGKIVARLKGGDPYIFGRGGEEGEALHAAGIPFEEVPGVSSAVAVPAYAGIPVTHRDFASSVTIITGNENPGKGESAHNWQALAHSASTLVFVMGVANLPAIAENLVTAGLDPQTPAALVHRGTTPQQRSLVSTIARLPDEARNRGFTNPSVIVVGKVAWLAEKLNWFERRPLFGKSVVVTRALKQASGIASALAQLGAQVLEFPTIRIRPPEDFVELDAAIARLQDYDWVIFTSVNGVSSFFDRLSLAGNDSRALAGRKVAAIGPATAGALAGYGIRADFVPEHFVAESVTEGLLRTASLDGRRILLPRAAKARDVLPQELRKAGTRVDVVTAYETVPAGARKEETITRLKEGSLDCVTFGSSSTVENFLALVPPDVVRQSGARLAAIGPMTAQTLCRHRLECHIMPEKYTISALVEAVKIFFAPCL